MLFFGIATCERLRYTIPSTPSCLEKTTLNRSTEFVELGTAPSWLDYCGAWRLACSPNLVKNLFGTCSVMTSKWKKRSFLLMVCGAIAVAIPWSVYRSRFLSSKSFRCGDISGVGEIFRSGDQVFGQYRVWSDSGGNSIWKSELGRFDPQASSKIIIDCERDAVVFIYSNKSVSGELPDF